MPTGDTELIIEAIRDQNIGFLLVDPLAEMHSVNENDNAAMRVVGSEFRRIAQETNCAVCLVHHSRKLPAGSAEGHQGSLDSGRGASVIGGMVRYALTIYSMTEQEAVKFAIDEADRPAYIRVDDAKANLGMLSGSPTWFKKVGVELPNADGLKPGDTVGVLEHKNADQMHAITSAAVDTRNVELHRLVVRVMAGFDEKTVNQLSRELAPEGYKITLGGQEYAYRAVANMLQTAFAQPVQIGDDRFHLGVTDKGKHVCIRRSRPI